MNNTKVKPIRKLKNADIHESIIVSKVLDEIPIPKDGKDAPTMREILAEIPVPENGKDGDDGKDAPNLKTIIDKIKPLLPKAEHGLDGLDGLDGISPAHEIDEKRLRIRFREPDGEWGEWLELGKELGKLIARQMGAYTFRGGGNNGSGGGGNSNGIRKKCIEGTVTVQEDEELIAHDFCVNGTLILDGEVALV